MKKIFLGLVFVLSLFLTGTILAQDLASQTGDPEEIAAQYGVTFPIDELGGCGNYSECRTYCEDPANFDTCIAFAKAKGFYQSEDEEEIRSLLTRARTSLGCGSIEECRSFCEQEVNYNKCHSFATTNGLVGGYVHDVDSGEFLDKAREVLGCDSYESCHNFCENPANRDKCSQFASQVGAGGGYEYRGPGGCTTEETCREFCTNPVNVDICRQFSQSHGGSFSGPGGCNDESSCRSYCEKNPSACSGFGESQASLAEYCSKTPGCSWDGSTCTCSSGDYGGDPAAECSKYGCSWTGSYCYCSSSDAGYLDRQTAECSKYPGCSWSGDHCQCSSSEINYSSYSSDPAAECTKYSGCSWTGSSCQCSGSPTYETPSSDSGGSYDPATECAKTSGCSWTGTSCQCSSSGGSSGGSSESTTTTTAEQPSSGGSTTDPATACAQTSGCSWDGSICQCSSVQGVATVYIKTWWQRLLDLLK